MRDPLKAVLACALILAGSLTTRAAAPAIPVVYTTDLFHPHDDADDHLDLATLFAVPELDVKAVILDQGAIQEQRPGRTPIEQMRRLSGRDIPCAVGLTPLKSPADVGRDQPSAYQAGVELILKVLREADRPVRIITAGSVRDVQAAFNREPNLVRSKVEGLYINIGNSSVGGDEYNVMIDRAAYCGLVRSGLPIWWYPCFPADGRNTTYYRLTQFPETLKACPPGLKNYFLYAIRRLDPAQVEPLAALTADLGAPDEALRAAPPFQGGKEMWCTPSFLQAAGRSIYRVGGRYVSAHETPPDGEAVRVFDHIPARLVVDDQGKPTRIDLDVPDGNVHLVRLADPKLYQAAMNDCLDELLRNFPTGPTKSP